MNMPRRDIPALIEALRIRALALTGAVWERTATHDMMKEAAQQLHDLHRAAHIAEIALRPFASRVYSDGVDAPYPEDEWRPQLHAAHDAHKTLTAALSVAITATT